MRKLSHSLYRRSSTALALAALVIFGLFTALVLPGQARQAEASSGSGASPDTSFFYTPEALYQMAEDYGPAGRAAYVRARLTFDVVWPLVYTFFLLTAISWLFARAFAPDSAWRLANLAPIAALLFDFAENFSTSLVMARYPAPTPVIAALAPWFTALKWVFVGGSFALVGLGLAAVLWRRVTGRPVDGN